MDVGYTGGTPTIAKRKKKPPVHKVLATVGQLFIIETLGAPLVVCTSARARHVIFIFSVWHALQVGNYSCDQEFHLLAVLQHVLERFYYQSCCKLL